ncbi:MAG: imidazole glycerol phosphate synthase subunit HisH [Synergistaceae bacterium]|jgi:glutamine amidotransferase|nr:imidazole glycerol phosphate synthase subunit HisH [Synergistaceae bacterium]
MIGIIDYGMGNLRSVENAFRSLGFEIFIATAPHDLDRADRVILPGVGAFQGAIQTLRRQGWSKKIKSEIERGKPFLGICLGMQLLFEVGEENGTWRGLGILPGKVTRIPDRLPSGEEIKIPHIGWNSLTIRKKSDIFGEPRETSDGPDGAANSTPYVYFVHSYSAETEPGYVSASTFYGAELTAAVEWNNVYAVQFHPEKSGAQGMKILKKFATLEPRPHRAFRGMSYVTAATFGGWTVDSFPRH